MKNKRSITLIILALFLLISCGKKSYVVFDYNCNGMDYHKCELKDNKLNCNVETPTCGEYEFKGWYRANEYNDPIDLNGTFNKNEIIYARWEKGNGRIEPSSREEPTSTIVTPGIIDVPSSSSEIPSSSKEEPSSSQQQPVDPPKPEETYTISFNLNGGTGGQTTSISGVKYNQTLPSINQNKPIKPGYTFQGWYDSQNGGTQYYNSSNSPVKKYDKRGNITLYAHWTINTLSIEYNGNGGSWNSSNSTYGVNGSNTVIVKSTNKVYQKVLNYGAKLESSGLVDYSGSWFNWTRSGYIVENKKEYIIGSTVIDQNKIYSAVELSRYGGCDLSKTNCTITVKVNWKKDIWDINKDYGTGKWVFYNRNSDKLKKYYSKPLAFAEYVPEKTISSGDSLPLIIWLHGNGNVCNGGWVELGSSHFVRDVTKWKETGLKNIPAVIMAPQLFKVNDNCVGWGVNDAIETIRALVKYAKDSYKINTNKVVLIGFSLGGTGVYRVSPYTQDLFSALIVISSEQTPKSEFFDYYKKTPMKGYTESWAPVGTAMVNSFELIGHKKDLTKYSRDTYPNLTHGDVARIAILEDKNNDKVSDLIYWALSQTKSK